MGTPKTHCLWGALLKIFGTVSMGFPSNILLLCGTNMTKFNCKLAHHKKLGNTFLLNSYLSVQNGVGNSFAAGFS